MTDFVHDNGGMKTIMNEDKLNTIEQLEQFLSGTQDVEFSPPKNKKELYQWIQKKLCKFRYMGLSKREKGVVKKYLIKVGGYSDSQITRLITQYTKKGTITRIQSTKNGFHRRYTDEDIRLLERMDQQHESPCGYAIKKLCERAFEIYNEEEFKRLSSISSAHIYNLRRSTVYRNQRQTFNKTKSKPSTIGERRKPRPDGKPGYIRIDTVHQGDLDKQKGVYYINAVDEVTQFEVVFAVERISERYLLPVLEKLLEAFPFVILGFHSDNGSEYINSPVAKLLEKLLIEFTKSRSRHSNDNALAESKNNSIVRKFFGYDHIPQYWADTINVFNEDHLNPYINYHRPCFFPKTETDSKGKQHKKYLYEDMMTPYDKLKSFPNADQYLKPETSFDDLDKLALEISDNEAAERLQEARIKLFGAIHKGTSGQVETAQSEQLEVELDAT